MFIIRRFPHTLKDCVKRATTKYLRVLIKKIKFGKTKKTEISKGPLFHVKILNTAVVT